MKTTSNVVVYTVVIDVDNSDLRLMPGMTAFVSLVIEEKSEVLRLSTSALQYKPNAFVRQFVPKEKVELSPTQAMVYRLEKGKLKPVIFEKGLADTSWIEVKDGIKEGEKVITEFIQNGGKKR